MSVYVDIAKIPYRGMLLCRMYADTPEELHQAAARLHLKRWAYKRGVVLEHYTVGLTQRAQAIRNGAISVNQQWVTQRKDALLSKQLHRCA
jgi:hypothetical protein